jgi:PAS domain S-box-containing protein
MKTIDSSRKRYILLLFIWSVLLGGSLLRAMQQETHNTLDLAEVAARANISKDISFRRWATSHGGVYVPPTEHTPPNLYLKVPERDVVTTTGKKLTLMNPAYMLRELQTDFPGDYGNKSHITSLKLINPLNAPDAWEIAALRAFDAGEKERKEVQQIDGQPTLRMMRPLIAEAGCLKCHAFQGYKVGENRGGISTTIALTPYLAHEREVKNNLALTHGAIWLIGLIGLGFSYRRDCRIAADLPKFAAIVEYSNETEASLRKSEALLQATMKILPVGIWIMDAEGKVIFGNAAGQQIWAGAHYVGIEQFGEYKGWWLDSGKLIEAHEWGAARAIEKGETSIEEEVEIECFDGTHKIILNSALPLRDSAGNISGAIIVNQDISARKKTEKALHENERFLDVIVEHVPNMLFVKDAAELKFVRFNKAGEQLLGYSRDDLIGKNDRDFFPKEQADFFIAKDREIIASGEMLDIPEEPINTKLLGQRYLHTRKLPIYAEDGSPLYLMGISEDITERKLEEENLRRSEQGLSEAQRIAHLGNWSLDLLTNALSWSDEIYRIFEIDPEQFGASYDAFLNAIHPDDREMVNKAYTDSVANKTPYEIEHRLLMPDGRIKYVNEKCETHYDAEGKPLRSIGTVHDITARKRAEDELLEREKHSQSLLSLSRKLESSQTYAEVLNAARDEVRSVIGYQNLWAYLLSEDKQSARALMADGPMSDAVMSDERVATLPVKGDRMMEEIAAAKEIIVVEDAQTDERVNREVVAKLGNRSIINVPIIFYDRHLGSVGMGTFGAEGVRIPSASEKKYLMALASHIAAALDRIHLLIERAKAEVEINELNRDLEQRVGERTAQLEAANKELEAFSYSVSHDLRTPLRAIDGFSHILLEDFSDKLDAEGQRLLNVVRDNTQRMGQLIDDILKFSRTGRVEMNAVEINMEQQAREVFAELLPGDDHGKLQFEIEAIPPFTGDNAMMRQVFVNLLSNAVKFSRAKEHPAIKVGAYIEGNEAVYYVKDNGAGFDMQYAGKLFGVFQRLHSMEEFEGTGIGLAIVKRIITRHGGRVWAEGKVGEGATFYFALPVRA